MNSITPDYYASGERVTTYMLTGINFDLIPSDALGVYAADNNEPLADRYTELNSRLFEVTDKTDTTMTLTVRQPGQHSQGNYLGGIVSEDRQIVYWMNETKPVPQL